MWLAPADRREARRPFSLLHRQVDSVELLRLGNHRIDIWIVAAFFLLALHIAVLVVLQSRPGVLGVVLWYLAPPLITIVAICVLIGALIQTIRRRLTWSPWRAAGYGSLALVVAMPLAYRKYPSSRDDHPSAVRFQLPLDGPVTVAWGGATPAVNYHVVLPDQRWAYDLLVTRDGRSFHGDGKNLTDYYAYGRPILSPATGIVRRSFDDDPDVPAGKLADGTNPCGNHLVLEVASNEFLFICHIQPQSIAVIAGDHVTAGQIIGRVGNSGNTSQPHVHLHLQTTAEPVTGEAIPLFFHEYRVDGQTIERGIPTGGNKQQIVEQVRRR
jgi:murein DD-endopeptidase MepM/ murein hydrolase activator NlpD